MGTLLQGWRRAITALLGLGAAFWLLGAGAAHSESYHYDAAGRLTQAAYSDGATIGFIYDVRGNLLTRLASAAGTDSDGDGLADSVETGSGVFVDASDTGTNPLVADTDGDGLADGVETGTGTFVDASDTGTNPLVADSDGDEASDGVEVAAGTDPNDAADFPGPAVPALTAPGVGLLVFLLAAAALQWIRVRRRRGLAGGSGPGRGWMAVWLVPALLVASAGEVRAHYCGDKGHGSFAELDLQVGQSFNYVIRADVAESEATQYSVASLSPPGIVTVSPAAQATLQRAVFQILAVAPGQTFVGLSWLYPPNFDPETGEGQGMCFLQVNVSDDPADADPPTTANDGDSGTVEDPVSSFSGELFLPWQVDLDLGGPLPLRFSRYYASDLAQDGEVIGALGAGWMHNFELRSYSQGDERRIVYFGGAVLRFSAEGGGSFTLIEPLEVPYQLVSDSSDLLLGDPHRELIYRFDDSGRLTAITDRNGNTLTLSYDQFNLTQVADGLGRVLTFTYADGNALSTVSDGTRTWSFAVATFSGVLSSATDPLGNTTQYSYSNELFSPIPSQLLQVTRPEGNSPYQQSYDSERRVATQTSADGDITSLAYANPSTTITNPLGGTVVHTHDADGDLTAHQDEAGQVITLGYDAAGRRSSVVDRLGGTTSLSYHAASGKIASITRADTTVTSFTYAESPHASGLSFFDLVRVDHPDGTFETWVPDAAGNPTSHTDQAGETWAASFNARGQVVTRTNAKGAVDSFAYGADGTRASATDSFGESWSFQHDTLRRPVGMTAPDASSRTWGLDLLDRTTAVTDETGQTETLTWDGNSRLGSVTDALGNTRTNTYDTQDRVTTSTNAAADATAFEYDARSRRSAVEAPEGERAETGYDAVGHIATLADGAGGTWTIASDAEGRPTSVTDPLGQQTSFTTDELGRVVALSSPLGITSSWQYDAMGRVTAIVDGLGDETTMTYDARGLVTGVALALDGVSASYGRNALGQVESVTDPGGAVWSREHDAAGRLTKVEDPLGRERSYSHDTRGRVSGSTLPGGGTMAVTRDAVGRATKLVYSDATEFNFTRDALGQITAAEGITWAYDAASRLSESNGIAITRDGNGRITTLTYAPGKSVQYEYDARGLLQKITDWLGGETTLTHDAARRPTSMTHTNGVVATFALDADNRLTGATHTLGATELASVSFTRDARDRILSATRTGAAEIPAAAVTPAEQTLAYDAASQVNSYGYDALGRVAEDDRATYTWDLASRLTTISPKNGDPQVSMSYDAAGLRVSRTVGAETRESVWNYALGLPGLAIERQGGADTRYFVHQPGGTLLYEIDAVTGARLHLHGDGSGNVTFVTDDAGVVVATAGYAPYGKTLAATGTGSAGHGFQGVYGVTAEDAVEGLHYMRARWYDAASARFLSKDPVRVLDVQSLNPYQYAQRNPLSYVDPAGLDVVVNTYDGAHTDVLVDVWRGDEKIGVFYASYSLEDGIGWAFLPFVGGNGTLSTGFTARPGGIDGVQKRPEKDKAGMERYDSDKGDVRVKGTREQDERLLRWILKKMGKDPGDESVGKFLTKMRVVPTNTAYGTYTVYTQVCNDFTDEALDVYYGFNWSYSCFWLGDMTPWSIIPAIREFEEEQEDERARERARKYLQADGSYKIK